MNAIRIRLLNELLENGDRYVSGEELSHKLHVSRTAIWKHIEELRREGYSIAAQRKQGYKILSIPQTLNASTILPYLETKWLGQHLHVFAQVESTQLIMQKLAREGAPAGTVVIADQQLAGKGRMGRKWHSPPGTGIWMSLLVRPEIPLTATPQLTLLSSVAVLRGVKQITGLEIGIKWPNDLLIGKKKISGILTELSAETDRVNHVIVGIGMNVNHTQEDFPEELHDIATSLRLEKGEEIDRNQLIISILKEWEALYELYIEHGFAPIKLLWESHAVSLGRVILARTVHGQYEGIATGITEDGILLLEDANGVIHKIYSADIETF